MEFERTTFDQLKTLVMQRQSEMQERRQTLLKQLGNSPAEMTRRSLREQISDPNVARLRTEFDNLKIAHERDMRQAEDRERDLHRKLRVFETEAERLQELAVDGEKLGRRVQELSEQLRKREHELTDERKNRESEREQFQGSQKALLARIESLERGQRPETPDEMQMADARSVKLASWMRFKR